MIQNNFNFSLILTFGKAVEECHTQKIFYIYGKDKIKRASKTEALHFGSGIDAHGVREASQRLVIRVIPSG
jgi:hypothetical protein